MNVNRGHSGLTPQTGSGSNTGGRVSGTGWNTPTQRRVSVSDADGEKRDKPVFLAELLDDDSVVQFYEDFARLAFGDSRGSVFRKGKLLKYRTKDDEIARGLKDAGDLKSREEGQQEGDQRPQSHRKETGGRMRELKKEGISGEKGMQKLGSADGKVDCAYCWTVKRDVFDIPMLIVMNVSTVRVPKYLNCANIEAVSTLHMSYSRRGLTQVLPMEALAIYVMTSAHSRVPGTEIVSWIQARCMLELWGHGDTQQTGIIVHVHVPRWRSHHDNISEIGSDGIKPAPQVGTVCSYWEERRRVSLCAIPSLLHTSLVQGSQFA